MRQEFVAAYHALLMGPRVMAMDKMFGQNVYWVVTNPACPLTSERVNGYGGS